MTDSQTQIDLETVYSKHQLLPVLRTEFMVLAEQYPIEEDHDMIAEMLSQLYLHRQCDPLTMVGILHPKFGEPQEIADKLLLFCDFDYMDYDPVRERFMVKYEVDSETQTMLDQFQYPLPMVTKPLPVTKNNETGYHTISKSVVLNGSSYFRDKDMCLDHLNRANSVELELNLDVVTSAEGKFEKPVRKNGEDFDDFSKRRRQAETFYNTSLNVMEALVTLSPTLFMTHRYDRRGRCYSSGYHINPQGTDWNKAVLQLHEKEVLT